MTQVSERFSVALSRMRREVEAAFHGNAYYLAAQHVQDIAEATGAGPAEADAAGGFAPALRGLRSSAEADLTGNVFYAVSGKLEALAFLAERAGLDLSAPETETAAAEASAQAQSQHMNGASRSMDDLAAASQTRLQEVSATLGLTASRAAADDAQEAVISGEAAPPSVGIPDLPAEPAAGETAGQPPATEIRDTQQAETLADGELERRSSEPCDLPAFDSERVETVQAASLPADPVPGAPPAEPQADLGPQDAAAGGGGEPQPVAVAATPEESAATPAPQPAAPQDDPAPAAAGKDIATQPPREMTPEENIEAMQREQKSLFMLWLDIVFGRKRDEKRGED